MGKGSQRFCLKRKCGKLGNGLQRQRNILGTLAGYNRTMFLEFLRRLDNQSLALRELLSSLLLGFHLAGLKKMIHWNCFHRLDFLNQMLERLVLVVMWQNYLVVQLRMDVEQH